MGSRVTTMIGQIYLFAAKQEERMDPWLIGNQFGWSSNRFKFNMIFLQNVGGEIKLNMIIPQYVNLLKSFSS